MWGIFYARFARVRVADEDTDEEQEFMIVGPYESDAEKGKISNTAPLAKALIGKTVGDSVEVTTPGGTKSYEILDIRFE